MENLGIIFEFSPWVLKICPEDGLKVRPAGKDMYITYTLRYTLKWSASTTTLTLKSFFLMVQIFTEDLTEVETLPRHKVLNFLREGFKELAIPYLEHIIHVWDDEGPEFHNVLIQLYLERVQSLMKQYLNSLPEGMSQRKLWCKPLCVL